MEGFFIRSLVIVTLRLMVIAVMLRSLVHASRTTQIRIVLRMVIVRVHVLHLLLVVIGVLRTLAILIGVAVGRGLVPFVTRVLIITAPTTCICIEVRVELIISCGECCSNIVILLPLSGLSLPFGLPLLDNTVTNYDCCYDTYGYCDYNIGPCFAVSLD